MRSDIFADSLLEIIKYLSHGAKTAPNRGITVCWGRVIRPVGVKVAAPFQDRTSAASAGHYKPGSLVVTARKNELVVQTALALHAPVATDGVGLSEQGREDRAPKVDSCWVRSYGLRCFLKKSIMPL